MSIQGLIKAGKQMYIGAGSVAVAQSAFQQNGGGSTPTPALHDLIVRPIQILIARRLIERHHYLRTLPGGTRFAFGVFVGKRLQGAVTLGVGSVYAHRLIHEATPDDCLTLTRLWLSDDLPRNSESRVLGIVSRALRSHTNIRFLLSYADPSQGHLGTIYQASGWLYTGLSDPTPRYDIGDGVPRHSRTLSTALGTRALDYLRSKGLDVKTVPQSAKHRYVLFLDRAWRHRLRLPILPFPKKEVSS